MSVTDTDNRIEALDARGLDAPHAPDDSRAAPVRDRGRGEVRLPGPPTDEGGGERMIMNMGPQHPSTHGVLRLVLELDGETIRRSKPVIGYLHTGMEKTGEDLTYVQGATNVTRMDYAAPLFNELAFSLATEELLGIEVPERAQWIRMLMCEMNRLVVAPAVHGHQRHGPRRRVDDALRLARARGGAALPRDGHRPADEPQLHPPRWRGRRPARRLARRRCCGVLEHAARPHRRVRHPHDRTSRSGASGSRASASSPPRRPSPSAPPGRSCARTGYAWDLRRDMPYLRYDEVDFDVMRRHLRRQLRPLRHPPGRDRRVDSHHPPDARQDARRRLPDPGQEGHPTAAGPHRRVDGGAHPPLQDLHRGLQGARGRGLRGGRVTPGRAGLLHGVGRVGEAVPDAHPGPELREPPDPPPPHEGLAHRRHRRHRVARSTRSWARSTDDRGHGSPPENERARPRDHRPVPACRSRPPSRCATWPRSRTATSPTTPWPTSPSSSASPRPRCSAPPASTRCSSASRSAATW